MNFNNALESSEGKPDRKSLSVQCWAEKVIVSIAFESWKLIMFNEPFWILCQTSGVPFSTRYKSEAFSNKKMPRHNRIGKINSNKSAMVHLVFPVWVIGIHPQILKKLKYESTDC